MNSFTNQKTNSNRSTNKRQKPSQNKQTSPSKDLKDQSTPTKKKRNFEKECQLLGSINVVDRKKVTRKGENYGRTYFEINVKDKIENAEVQPNKEIKIIYAFQDIIKKEKVWKDLETHQWVDKRFLFLCLYHTKMRLYRLYDWVEINTK